MQRLLSRRRRAVQELPPLEEVVRGSVFVRMLRCGKPGCHCVTGEKHRATYLSVSFPGGRTEQISLPPDLVPLARRWVANYGKWWEAVEKVSAINRKILRSRRSAEGSARRGNGRGRRR